VTGVETGTADPSMDRPYPTFECWPTA
jgi:hypothetical protein